MIRHESRTFKVDIWRGIAILGLAGVAVLVIMVVPSVRSFAQSTAAVTPAPADLNSAPNPGYTVDVLWAKMTPDRRFGMVGGVAIDRDGKSVWVFDRCGWRDCSGTQAKVNPVMEFDSTGKLVRSWGAGLFYNPHGIYVDKDDNVWLTDYQAKDGKGDTVQKFTPDGKLLMTLGTPGVAGTTDSTFNGPSHVLVAPNGDIFVGDGHGGKTNARIVKFSPDGKFIKTWGQKGSGPGDISTPHSLAMDSTGRLFVADRGNGRIQIFDQDGNLLAIWKQFGDPSDIYIDPKDTMYVADNGTITARTGSMTGVRIGSAKDGVVKMYVPWPEVNVIEAVTADDSGNIFAGFVQSMDFRRFSIKQAKTSSTAAPAGRPGGN